MWKVPEAGPGHRPDCAIDSAAPSGSNRWMLLDQSQVYIGLFCALLIGMAKGGLSGGLGMLVVPILSLLMDPRVAAAITLPVLIISDMFAVGAYWGKDHRPHLKVLLAGALIGVLIGALTFQLVNEAMMRLLLGLIALGFVLLRWFGPAQDVADPDKPANLLGLSMGALSGFSSFTAHAGQPPVQIYLLPRRLDKLSFQSTVVMYFTLVNLMKLPPYIYLGQFTKPVMMTALMMLPAAGIGVYLGYRLQHYIPEKLFFRLMHALLFLTGLKLTYDGIVQLMAQ